MNKSTHLTSDGVFPASNKIGNRYLALQVDTAVPMRGLSTSKPEFYSQMFAEIVTVLIPVTCGSSSSSDKTSGSHLYTSVISLSLRQASLNRRTGGAAALKACFLSFFDADL